MRTEEMHWQFKLVHNKVNSNHKRSFSPNEIDALLNRGINEYVEMFYKGTNSKGYNIGFEVTQQRIDMLSTLVVGQPEQPALSPDSVTDDVYQFKLSNLEHEYQHFLRGYAKIPGCKALYNVTIEQTDDINKVLDDANRAPSAIWQRVVGQFRKSSTQSGSSSLYLYTNGDFVIDKLNLEYLKKPAQVCLGTYTGLPILNGPTPIIKPQVHCDLPSAYHDLIVDIAVQEATRILEDVNRVQLRDHRINKISN